MNSLVLRLMIPKFGKSGHIFQILIFVPFSFAENETKSPSAVCSSLEGHRLLSCCSYTPGGRHSTCILQIQPFAILCLGFGKLLCPGLCFGLSPQKTSHVTFLVSSAKGAPPLLALKRLSTSLSKHPALCNACALWMSLMLQLCEMSASHD